MSRVPISAHANGILLHQGTFAPDWGARASIVLHGTDTPVTVYTDEFSNGTLSQPLTADTNGQLPGWVVSHQALDVVPVGGAASLLQALDAKVIAPISGSAADDAFAIGAGTGQKVSGFPTIDPTLPPYNAVFDSQHVTDAAVPGALNQVVSVTAGPLWQAVNPVGKSFLLSDQGTSNAADLWGTVTAFDGVQTITVSANAAAICSAQMLAWGTDDTTAVNVAFTAQAANPGSTIKLPTSGLRRAMYNGAGLSSTNPAMVAPCLASAPQFYLGPTSSLIVSPAGPAAIVSLHLANIFTYGGTHPLVRLTWTGVNSSFSRYIVENCRAEYFRGTAVSSLATDHPYWKIKVAARNPLIERGMGVALAGYTDACDIVVDCLATQAGLKVGLGGNNARFHDSSWVQHAYAGTPRIGVWHVPNPIFNNSGVGFQARGLRFPNEGYNNADIRVLFADEDIDTGADFASRTPLWTPSMVNTPVSTTTTGTNNAGANVLNVTGGAWASGMTIMVGTGGTREIVTVGTYTSGTAIPLTGTLANTHAPGERVLAGLPGWISGISYSDCTVHGAGTPTTGPVFYSTTTNVTGFVGSRIGFNSTPPAICFQYLVLPSGAAASMTNRLENPFTVGVVSKTSPTILPSNDPGMLVVDPGQVFYSTKLAHSGGADRGGYLRLLQTRIRSFSLTGTPPTSTVIQDDLLQSDGAEINFLGDFDTAFAPLVSPVVGRPIWIEFAAKQAAAGGAPAMAVRLAYTGNATIHDQWWVQVGTSWQTYRLFHAGLREAVSTVNLEFQCLPGMAHGKIDIARPRAYHNVEPVPRRDAFVGCVQPIMPLSGQYLQPQYVVQTPTVIPTGSLRVCPVCFAEDWTLAQMFTEFTVAGSADSTFICCVYNDNGSFYPADLICQAPSISTGTGNAGSVATGGTPGVYASTISQALKAGLFWIGGVPQGTTGATMRMGSWAPGAYATASLPGVGATIGAYQQISVSGALPTSFSTGVSNVASLARVGIKAT